MTTLFKKKFMRVPHLSILDTLREIGRNAHVDWVCILLLSVSTLITLILGWVFLYWQISTGNYGKDKIIKPRQEKVFDIKELNAVISKFNLKEKASIQARQGYIDSVDPSK